jgi:hypothetical protein
MILRTKKVPPRLAGGGRGRGVATISRRRNSEARHAILDFGYAQESHLPLVQAVVWRPVSRRCWVCLLSSDAACDDLPFRWFCAPVSRIQCHSLINTPVHDLKDKNAAK